jgi:hypothetical protein
MANIRTLNLVWQGPSGASATGSITLDTDQVPQGGEGTMSFDAVQSLTVTISGARAGNGTFTKPDFTSVRFYSMGPLDFSRELFGQEMGGMLLPFGTEGAGGMAGDFNLKGPAPAPQQVSAFNMVTNGKNDPSDFLELKSIAP